jgi:autoinducer 2-degrading protein
MHTTLVHVRVYPEHIDNFIDACQLNHEASIEEPGNIRFDILQSADDPCYFILYEAYTNAEAAAAHKQAPHYLAWRETVANWMAEPREGKLFNGLFP